MVFINVISNCPISVSDIWNSEKIYGPSIASLKGKLTRSKPRTVIKDDIWIPSEIYKKKSKIELFIGAGYINGVAFLVYIDRKVKYRSIIHTTTHNEEGFFKFIDKILLGYNLAGFTITIINADNGFKTLMDNDEEELDITMSYTNPRDHVPEIEQNNITFREIYRAQYHRFPFQNIPKVMIRYLDFEVVIKLNYFPVKGNLSPYYSPWTIFYQQPLDYKIDCTIPFRAFVQANNDNNPKSQLFCKKMMAFACNICIKYKAGMINSIYTFTELLQYKKYLNSNS